MGNRTGVHTAESQAKRDRTQAAESKIKRLRVECEDLRKQLHRAQETARIADEEAQNLRQSLAAMTFSRDAARDRCAWLQAQLDVQSERAADPSSALMAPKPTLLQRLTGRSA